MNLIAIGDVHGCARTLDALLARLAPTADDHLVFVGDYGDRGPDTRGVIDRLLVLEAEEAAGRGPRCTFLRGNHDQMMLDYAEGRGDFELWRINGGVTTLLSYFDGASQQIPVAHVDFLRRTRLYLDTPDFVFVHAGLKPNKSVEDNLRDETARTFLWERGHLHVEAPVWEKTVVCGHTPQREPLDLPRLLCIDTGAVYVAQGYGQLTAVRLPERTFVQVPFAD